MAIQFKSVTGFDYVSAANPLPVTIVSSPGGPYVLKTGDTMTGNLVFSDAGEGISLAGGGTMTGASGAITLAASGTNQNVTATPSGTGNFVFTGTNSALASGGMLTFSQSGSIRIGTIGATSGVIHLSRGFDGGQAVGGRIIRIDAVTSIDSSTAGSGTNPSMAFSGIAAPTLAATNSSVTTTDAATWYIAGAPINGTNMTITNPFSLWIDSGTMRYDGTLSTAVATPATHKVLINIGGTSYYMLLTNVA